MSDLSLYADTLESRNGPQRLLVSDSLDETLGRDVLGRDVRPETLACRGFEHLVAQVGLGDVVAVLLDCRDVLPEVAALRVATVRRLSRRAALLCVVRESAGVESVLEAGADDAVAEPWLPSELRARLRARVRERRAGFAEVLRAGPLEFVLHEARAIVGGQLLPLRRAEYCVLLYLAQQEGRPVTASEILNEVLGTRGDGGTVRNHIMALRRALSAVGLPNMICTDRGRGYRLAQDAREQAHHA
jgi:two-component system OmpR family response regulator